MVPRENKQGKGVCGGWGCSRARVGEKGQEPGSGVQEAELLPRKTGDNGTKHVVHRRPRKGAAGGGGGGGGAERRGQRHGERGVARYRHSG